MQSCWKTARHNNEICQALMSGVVFRREKRSHVVYMPVYYTVLHTGAKLSVREDARTRTNNGGASAPHGPSLSLKRIYYHSSLHTVCSSRPRLFGVRGLCFPERGGFIHTHEDFAGRKAQGSPQRTTMCPLHSRHGPAHCQNKLLLPCCFPAHIGIQESVVFCNCTATGQKGAVGYLPGAS